MAAPIPYVRAAGSPFDLGLHHGAARATALRAFQGDALCRLNRILHRPVTPEQLRPVVAAYRAAIEAAAPDLGEEIAGLAAGAGLELELAYLLQLRREILGYRTVPAMGDCTTYARSAAAAAGNPVLAQTVDLNGDLDDQIAVLDLSRAGSRRRSLILSFAGLLGYLGINSDGLAVGLNLVLGGDWGPGLPPYLAIRHLLDHASRVDEAMELLHELPLASSRSITLCDATKTASAEFVAGELRFVEGPETTHANHLLHPELLVHDRINPFARRSSVRRLDACRARLTELSPEAGPEDHFAVLSTTPVRVTGNGDIRHERTVAAVVLLPDRGELHLRPGDPAHSTTQVFSLR